MTTTDSTLTTAAEEFKANIEKAIAFDGRKKEFKKLLKAYVTTVYEESKDSVVLDEVLEKAKIARELIIRIPDD